MVKEVQVTRFETSDKSLFVNERHAKEYEELLVVFDCVKFYDSICRECKSTMCKIKLNEFDFFEVKGCHHHDKHSENHTEWFIKNYQNFKHLFDTKLKEIT